MNVPAIFKKGRGKARLVISENLNKDYLKAILVFSFLFIVFNIIYFSINRLITLDDHLFYIRYAEMIREQGLSVVSDFHWLYFSKFSENSMPIYYSFLFYLALIPFTYIQPLIFAIKVYGVAFFALSYAIFYYFLLKINVSKPFFWTILFIALSDVGQLGRFLAARPFTIAPALLLLELYFVYKRKYWGVFFISLVYFYWHNTTFIFTLMVPFLFVLFKNFYGEKTNLKPVIAATVAILIDFAIAGLFFPGLAYVYGMVFNIYKDTIIGKSINIQEGAEHYPPQFFDYIKINATLIILFTVSFVFEIFQYLGIKRGKEESANNTDRRALKSTLFFLSLLFFAGIFLTLRNSDFFVFVVAAYISISFNELASYVEIKKETMKKTLAVSVYLVCAYLFFGNLLFVQNMIASARPYDDLKGAAEWLKNNTDKKEIVFYPSWGWFPRLFYYNQDNYYVAGLAGRFLYDYDHELYWSWWNISNQGFLCGEEHCDALKKQKENFLRNEERKRIWNKQEGDIIADYIKTNFNSRFVLTSKDYSNLNGILENNDNFEKVFTDEVYNYYSIYKIR